MCKEIIDEIKNKVKQARDEYFKQYFWNTTHSYGAGKIDAAEEILAIIDYVVKSWGGKDA